MKAYYLNKPLASIFLFCLIFFGIGLFVGRVTKTPLVIRPKVLRETGYKYINPILLCNIDNQQAYNNDADLSEKLYKYIKNYKENGISVYFLSLVNGQWASVNENVAYSPASMLKVPTVVDALKYAESHPAILSKKVYYDGSFNDNGAEYFKPKISIDAGKSYSIDELLTNIIAYSDNNALTLLHNTINSHSLEEIYKDLKIEIPENTIDFMSVKTYSLFLRVLYNSTYLNREMSEKILKLMISSDFPQGLSSGVPKDIEIAKKFGERQIFSPTGELMKTELHDCGIVYAENNTYILCIMTSGKSFESLTKNIQDISKIVYDHTQTK